MDKFTKKRLIQKIEEKDKKAFNKIPDGHISDNHLAEKQRQRKLKERRIIDMQKKLSSRKNDDK